MLFRISKAAGDVLAPPGKTPAGLFVVFGSLARKQSLHAQGRP